MTTAAEMRDALLDRAVWHLRPKHARVNFRASLARDIDALIAQVEAETRAKACEMHETIIENYADSLRLLNDDYQVEAETRAGLVALLQEARTMVEKTEFESVYDQDRAQDWMEQTEAAILAALPAPAPVTEPVSRTNGKVREHDFCCYYQHEFGQSCVLPDPFVLTVTYGPDTAPTPVTEDALAGALHRAEIDCWPDVDGCAASGHRGAAYRLRAAIPAPEPSSGAAPVEERPDTLEMPSDKCPVCWSDAKPCRSAIVITSDTERQATGEQQR